MFITFLRHQWLSYWRSKSKGASIVARIFLVLLILYFLFLALAAGFFMESLIQKIFPTENTIKVFNGFLLYYFFADLLIRIQIQELPTLSIIPYLHLNIRRKKIVNFLNTKAILSFFNFLPIILFFPFCATNIAHALGTEVAVMYMVAIFSWAIFNNFLVLYLKRKAISNVLYLAVGITVMGAFAALEYFKYISLAEASNYIFTHIAAQPLLGFAFTVLAICIFFINSKYLLRNLYIEELSTKEDKKTSTDYPFLNQFGRVGELAALELKLILRHKRSRSSFFMGFFFLLYGFLFYKEPQINNDQFASLLFAALFMTGISIIMYGQYMFAWQSGHFDGILVNQISFKDFIKAKFLLFTIGSTIITILASFYGFISWKLLLLQVSAYLFNIGFGTVIVLWFATKNYKSLDLTKGASFNWQGTSAVQWLMSLPLLALPYLIYLPFGMTNHPFWGLIAIGLFGLITLLMRNFWVNFITKEFIKNRYKIAEGFRE